MSHVVRWKHYIDEWEKNPREALNWVLAMLWKSGIKPSDAINRGEWQGCFVIRTDEHVNKYKITIEERNPDE